MSVASLRFTLRGGKSYGKSLSIANNGNFQGYLFSNLRKSNVNIPSSKFQGVKGFATKANADGPHDYSYVEKDDRFQDNKPTIQYAKGMPRNFSAMRHEQILQLCVEGSRCARREGLIRNVMAVDEIEYDDAAKIVQSIEKENREMMVIEYLPYHAGIAAAVLIGIGSFPMVFDINTVLWFNERFVTADVPDTKDLETWLEVGSYSWAWMEPVIGQASFAILVMQYIRNQAINLGLKPYNDKVLSMRSKRMVARYPQYDPIFVEWFSESEAYHGKSQRI